MAQANLDVRSASTMPRGPQTALAAAMERAGLRPIHHRLRGLIFQMHADGIGEDEFNRVAAQAWDDARAKARERTGLIGDARGGQLDRAQQGRIRPAPAQDSSGEAIDILPSNGLPGQCPAAGPASGEEAGEPEPSDGPNHNCLPASAGSEAREGQERVASSDGGQGLDAPRAFTQTADGTGLCRRAADQRPINSCPPVRAPSPTAVAASLSVAKRAAVSVLDTLKIDGVAIGDWTVAEARHAGRTKIRNGYILLAATKLVANAPDDARLREVVKEAELQRIIQSAAEAADAV